MSSAGTQGGTQGWRAVPCPCSAGTRRNIRGRSVPRDFFFVFSGNGTQRLGGQREAGAAFRLGGTKKKELGFSRVGPG